MATVEDVRAAVLLRLTEIKEKAKKYYLLDREYGERYALEAIVELIDGKRTTL